MTLHDPSDLASKQRIQSLRVRSYSTFLVVALIVNIFIFIHVRIPNTSIHEDQKMKFSELKLLGAYTPSAMCENASLSLLLEFPCLKHFDSNVYRTYGCSSDRTIVTFLLATFLTIFLFATESFCSDGSSYRLTASAIFIYFFIVFCSFLLSSSFKYNCRPYGGASASWHYVTECTAAISYLHLYSSAGQNISSCKGISEKETYYTVQLVPLKELSKVIEFSIFVHKLIFCLFLMSIFYSFCIDYKIEHTRCRKSKLDKALMLHISSKDVSQIIQYLSVDSESNICGCIVKPKFINKYSH